MTGYDDVACGNVLRQALAKQPDRLSVRGPVAVANEAHDVEPVMDLEWARLSIVYR